jgi:hypothetical protein
MANPYMAVGMEKIASQRERTSFIYRGCYTASGGLSLAQRAAWGLAASPAGCMHQSELVRRQKAGHPCACNALYDVRVKPKAAPPTAVATQARARRQPRGGHLLHSQTGKRRWRLHPLAQRRWPMKAVVPYRRFCVTVNGEHISCIVFRGTPFVSAAARRQRSSG